MGAPKGNKNAVGNKGGAPPIHTDPKEVDTLIADYYDWIQGEKEEKKIKEIVLNEDGEPKEIERTVTEWVRCPEPPTVTGLALHLGFADKSSLYDYRDKVEFSHSIKRAITRIEKYHEIKASQGDKCVGNIFVLKNFGWTDKTETEVNIKSEQPLFPD